MRSKYHPIGDSMTRFRNRYRVADNGCWEWLGCGNSDGYGRMRADGAEVYAHRFSFENLVGPIPPGLHIDHLCRNRLCVNPAHLEAVPQGVNTLRGMGPPALNARKTQCFQGHALTEDNIYRTAGSNRRHCRQCKLDWEARKRRAA